MRRHTGWNQRLRLRLQRLLLRASLRSGCLPIKRLGRCDGYTLRIRTSTSTSSSTSTSAVSAKHRDSSGDGRRVAARAGQGARPWRHCE